MRIYDVSLTVVEEVCRLAGRVQQYDKDLARQMRRACASVPLNMQEGLYSRGGSRIARFHDAMGSARETMACLHVCVAARYVERAAVLRTLEHIDHVVAGLYQLCHKRLA
jgi:four helix bundle protein